MLGVRGGSKERASAPSNHTLFCCFPPRPAPMRRRRRPVSEWPLESLSNKMKQYCMLMEDLSEQVLAAQCTGQQPLESLRAYLRKRAVDAYKQKSEAVRWRPEGGHAWARP